MAVEDELGTPLSSVKECHVECRASFKQGVLFSVDLTLLLAPSPRWGWGVCVWGLMATESEHEAEGPSAEDAEPC